MLVEFFLKKRFSVKNLFTQTNVTLIILFSLFHSNCTSNFKLGSVSHIKINVLKHFTAIYVHVLVKFFRKMFFCQKRFPSVAFLLKINNKKAILVIVFLLFLLNKFNTINLHAQQHMLI